MWNDRFDLIAQLKLLTINNQPVPSPPFTKSQSVLKNYIRVLLIGIILGLLIGLFLFLWINWWIITEKGKGKLLFYLP